jgi:heat shock protein HslJ
MQFSKNFRRVFHTILAGSLCAMPVTSFSLTSSIVGVPSSAQAAEHSDDHDLSGELWQLQIVEYSNDETLTFDDPGQYTLEFSPDGSFVLRADCNFGSGSYTQTGSQISLEVGPLTRAACPPGSYSDRYLSDLSNVASFILEDNMLYLSLRVDGGILTFSTPPTPVQPLPSSLANSSWELSEMVYSDHRVVVTTPGSYTLSFEGDSDLSVRADCNLSIGSYTQTDDQLAIALGPTTLVACPPQSLSDQYLRDLSSVDTFTLEEDQLLVELQGEGGTLIFDRLDIDALDPSEELK